MFIKSITLDNFRIYRGVNTMELLTSEDHNIIIVSGDNGFGKTTFLMSLVWCLYGDNMGKVDDLYKTEIKRVGTYGAYIIQSLNDEARKEGKTTFSVTIDFTNVSLFNQSPTNVTIHRSYNTLQQKETLEIFIDGRQSELISDDEDEKEMFIRDNILPIEIAKFFFFDAEKIISFAQVNNPEQSVELSRAYSQVLGIQKYEDLKEELEKLKNGYRIHSSSKIQKEFQDLLSEISFSEDQLENVKQQIKEKEDILPLQQKTLDDLQTQLIRQGASLSINELNNLRSKGEECKQVLDTLQTELKAVYDTLPLGIAGTIVSQVLEQLKREKDYKRVHLQMEGVETKTEHLLDELNHSQSTFEGTIINRDVRDFYEKEVERLIKKYFCEGVNIEQYNHFVTLHNFSDLQYDGFYHFIEKVKESTTTFKNTYDKYKKVKNDLDTIQKKISDAEARTASEYIQQLRNDKERIENQIAQINNGIGQLQEQREQLNETLKKNRTQREQLSKQIDVAKEYKAIDEEASRLIIIIGKFLSQFRERKKQSWGEKIKTILVQLLQKQDFVSQVVVDITGVDGENNINIDLIGNDGKTINKGSLSMGELQLFATALLEALVEETGFAFPIFIDSPMQKLSSEHRRNILTKFYPTVSKQVVLFPLLVTEMSEEEFSLIRQKVNRTYLIENSSPKESHFQESEPDKLFENYYKKHPVLYGNQY